MNARYVRVSPISPPISDIRYENPPSDTIPISDIYNLDDYYIFLAIPFRVTDARYLEFLIIGPLYYAQYFWGFL